MPRPGLDRTPSMGAGTPAASASFEARDLEAVERGRKGLPRAWMTEAERAASVTRSVPLALAHLLGDFAIYLGLLALALLPLPVPVSLGIGVVCGLFIGNVFTLGHDAAHQSLTDHRRLNHWIARLAFLPAMHSLSLWIPGHNHLHHTFTNLRGKDYTWEPMSPEDYRQATTLRRALYRLYRSPFGSFPYQGTGFLPR